MITIIGINEISILLHKKITNSLLMGPFREKISEKHINENITPLSLLHNTKNSKTLIDATFNSVTSLIINDFALKHNKNLVSAIYLEEAIVIKTLSKGNCIRCDLENNRKTFNFVIATNIVKDKNKIVETILESLRTQKNFSLTEEKKEEIPSTTKGCKSCLTKEFTFLEGDYGEMINENCGDKSAGIFPIDDREIDIEVISKNLKLQNISILEETENYLSFLAEGKKFFLFKNGRLMISEIESKEEAEYFYRKYVGN